jgi:hypothetical protein
MSVLEYSEKPNLLTSVLMVLLVRIK